MLTFFLNRVKGWRVVALTAASLFYGWLIIIALPYWGRLVDAEGGREIQTSPFFTADDAGRALSAIVAYARQDAFIFYALDVPNALLYGASIAALIAFGLRRFSLAQTPFKWLVALPLLSAAADLAENACLAAALLTHPAAPGAWGAAAGFFTGVKLYAGMAAQALAIVGSVGGLALWAWQKLRRSAPPDPS